MLTPKHHERQSIRPTYDHRETGDRFTVETRVADRHVSRSSMTDPFMYHRITIGWRDLLHGLLRRQLLVEVIVSGDPEIVEDVLELNDDYLGLPCSSRRREWDAKVQVALSRFGAVSGDRNEDT